MSIKRKLNGPRIRFLLAVCLSVILFLATTTSESDDSFCSEHAHGDLLVTNKSSETIWFEFVGGPGTEGYIKGTGRAIYANSSYVYRDLRTGFYKYLMYIQKSRLGTRVGTFTIIGQTSVEVVYE